MDEINERTSWMLGCLQLAQEKQEVFFKLFGFNLWISDGTLLGFVREGGFIEHDADVDVSYLSSQKSLRAVMKEYYSILRLLKEKGENIDVWRDAGSLRSHFKWRSEDGRHHFDVFPSWINPKSEMFVGPINKCFPMSRSDMMPLQGCVFYGGASWVPSNATSYLKGVYGENWNTPDPEWSPPVKPPAACKEKKIKANPIIVLTIIPPKDWRKTIGVYAQACIRKLLRT